eukprot:scaffold1817_cov250-Pinguiococcus_pyrenoidosus.AAC.3
MLEYIADQLGHRARAGEPVAAVVLQPRERTGDATHVGNADAVGFQTAHALQQLLLTREQPVLHT